MPVIKRFNGYVLRMYFDDHNPPHVHVVGQEFQALVAIDDQRVLAGEIPPQHRKEAIGWIAANTTSLMTEWERMH